MKFETVWIYFLSNLFGSVVIKNLCLHDNMT